MPQGPISVDAHVCHLCAMSSMGNGQERSGCDVCVIDDDAGIRRSLRRLLQANGVTASCFSSAEAFIDQPIACERLIIDIQLPGLSGLELLDRLREAQPDLRAVLITGRLEAGIRREGLAHGARAVLAKPFSEAELFEALSLERKEF